MGATVVYQGAGEVNKIATSMSGYSLLGDCVFITGYGAVVVGAVLHLCVLSWCNIVLSMQNEGHDSVQSVATRAGQIESRTAVFGCVHVFR